jgi:hypothetical protein
MLAHFSGRNSPFSLASYGRSYLAGLSFATVLDVDLSIETNRLAVTA